MTRVAIYYINITYINSCRGIHLFMILWRDHIHIVEITKNIGLFCQGKHYLDKHCLKQIYFAQIHTYLNYVNIAWSSTHKTKLKKVQNEQKHALRIIFTQSKTLSSEILFLSLNALNVYQINIFQSVQFMHKVINKNTPHIFLKLFGVPCHYYLKNFFLINLSVPRKFLKSSPFAI